MKSWLVGVDEAGRGPLAGPVSVGLVKVASDFDWNKLPGVGDSKQIPVKTRERIFAEAMKLKQAGEIDFVVLLMSAPLIDKKGIANVIREAIKKGLIKLQVDSGMTHIKLDGSLKAPAEYSQETIIKGDNKELVIGLASILAKVTRDTYMCKLAKDPQFAAYNFSKHKGYGTKEHRRLIAALGLSVEHRTTYCQNVGQWGSL